MPGTERLERHLALESALLEASRLLLGRAAVDLRAVLGRVAEATGALRASLTILPPDDDQLAEGVADDAVAVSWPAAGVPNVRGAFRAEDPAATTVVVAVLSAEDRLYGHLGFEYEPGRRQWAALDQRALDVLGGLVAAYVERTRAEAALEASEHRWRRLVDRHPDPILVAHAGPAAFTVAFVNQAGVRLLGADAYGDLVGRSLVEVAAAPDADRLRLHLAVASREAPEAPLVFEAVRPDGERRLVEAYAVPARFRGREAVQLVLRDLTEQRRAEERHRTFVEAISEGIGRFELAAPLPTNARPEAAAAAVLGARLAESNRVMARLLQAATPDPILGQPLGALLPDNAAELAAAFVAAGFRLHDRAVTSDLTGERRHFVVNAVGTLTDGRLAGVWATVTEVTERVGLERRMVELLEAQQQRLGQDLHDGVGQLLTGIRLLSQTLVTKTPGDPLPEKIARYASDATAHIREIYRGLTPVQLFAEGLPVALDELAQRVDELPGVACTFAHDGRADVEGREAQLHVYRIAQEATNNALKHAKATRIALGLRRAEGGAVVLDVRDDGRGFDPGATPGTSLGLSGMRYRAQALGARLDLESAPGAGTVVRVTLPRAAAPAR